MTAKIITAEEVAEHYAPLLDLYGALLALEEARAEVERWRGMLEMVLRESVDIECGDRILYAGNVNDIRAALEKQP
jgi:hypothetical protein